MEIGTVKLVGIEDEMKGAYLDYAMSVITARALPDVRDGLKPVQRRILYAMHDMGLRPNRPYKKSARIVGEVLGKYHPHSDQAVYDAMVRMAQDFSMRYLLVDGQGNFGSVDGDSPAAMRYTEARLAPIAEEMLANIDQDTVDFTENFDGTLTEPAILPARLPNLLVSGASGIAVGMATNIPPHNLVEVCDAILYVIDHYDGLDDVSVDDLMQFIKGPDFPTGGSIIGTEGIRSAYVTGRGRVIIRAEAHIEDMKGGRSRIVVTELPYQVNKASLIERIARLVRDKRVDSISDLRDESDRNGMSIVIELKRGAEPRTTLNQLLKYTQMQSTFGCNMLALVDGEPRMLSLKKFLQHYVEHRHEIIARRSQYALERARHRAHVLEGLRRALDHLDEIINTIRSAPTAEVALHDLIRKFEFTEIQARAILDMQLRRLAGLERQKVEDEYAEAIKRIAYLEDLLASPRKILYVIKDELSAVRETYGDDRRTQIAEDETAEFTEEDLISQEDVLISITQWGYVKRLPASTYRPQRRGGRGIRGMLTREQDAVLHLFMASTLNSVLLFTDRGRVFQIKAHQIPEAGREARGVPLSNLIAVGRGEAVTASVAVPSFQRAEHLVMVTRRGRIKRTLLSEFETVRPSGLIAIKLDGGDELRWVLPTHGDDELILVTGRGKAIRFGANNVRPTGRTAAGVWGIKLGKNDLVTGADIVQVGADLLVVTANGYGKRTALTNYPPQHRYGRGVITLAAKSLTRTGTITDARVVGEDDEVTLISADGQVLRTHVKSIPTRGRATQGAIVMNLREKDTLVSIARLNRKQSED